MVSYTIIALKLLYYDRLGPFFTQSDDGMGSIKKTPRRCLWKSVYYYDTCWSCYFAKKNLGFVLMIYEDK